jgi:acetyltransferase-like isoleucine patch superfamily enzyme
MIAASLSRRAAKALPHPIFDALINSHLWVKKFRNSFEIARLRKTNIGRSTHVDKSVRLIGLKNIRIGANCVISGDCQFNVNHRSGDHVAISVGDHSCIGHRNFFGPGESIELGAFTLTAADCKFMCSDHIFSDVFKPYVATGTSPHGRIRIGTNCWIGAGAYLLGTLTIGHGSVIGAGALVTKSAPPFSLLLGTPAKIVKRYDVALGKWVSAESFSAEQEAAIPDEKTYAQILSRHTPELWRTRIVAGPSQGDLP